MNSWTILLTVEDFGDKRFWVEVFNSSIKIRKSSTLNLLCKSGIPIGIFANYEERVFIHDFNSVFKASCLASNFSWVAHNPVMAL